jgi:dihydrofolate reductase
MTLSLIVAAADNGVIGKDGKMPWRLPAESAYFKATTLGHPVIPGRKNFEAMGRPLPERLNVVITRQDYQVPDGAVVAHSFEEALALPQVKQADEVFVIGGQQIYEQAMPLADKLYFTQIDAKIDGDTFFNYNPNEWKLVWSEKHPADQQNEYAFELRQLVRKS